MVAVDRMLQAPRPLDTSVDTSVAPKEMAHGLLESADMD